MQTTFPGIDWAEAYLNSVGHPVYAALVRGNELYVRTHTQGPTLDKPEGEWITELYQFFEHGEVIPERIEECGPEVETPGGRVFMVYAWLDPNENGSDGELEALKDAQRKLDAYTEPAQRREKVIQLLRWSHLAQTGDFNLLEG